MGTRTTSFSSVDFVGKIQRQDRASIETLVRTYTKDLYRASLGMGFGESDANELVQRVWTTFFEKASSFQGRSHIRTYLFGMLYNKAREMRRQDARTMNVESPEVFEEVMGHRFDEKGGWCKNPVDPQKFYETVETTQIVKDCMNRLPDNQKMAFYLKEIEANRTEEICNILKVTATHLGVLLYRAKNQLRDCIDRKSRQ